MFLLVDFYHHSIYAFSGLIVCFLLYKDFHKFHNSKKMTSLQDFNNIITRMLSPENETRKEAEKQYDQMDLLAKTHLLFQLFMDQDAGIEVWLSVCFLLQSVEIRRKDLPEIQS